MTIEKQKDDLYRFVATDKHGYKSEIFDSDIDQGSMRCLVHILAQSGQRFLRKADTDSC